MIWLPRSSLGEVLGIDSVFCDIKGPEISHSNNVNYDCDPPHLNLTCSTHEIGSPWQGAWLKSSLSMQWHKAGELGGGQDLVFGISDTELHSSH